MAEDIEQRLSSIRARQQEAQRRHATAEAKLDQVRARREEVMQSLSAQGFSTPEEARARVESLKSETEEILADIEGKVGSL